jgi:pimeloyl-ACP methyl ester carboxylesterase
MQALTLISTHLDDIVNQMKHKNLDNIILVGNSFDGMVISKVTEQVPELIKQLTCLCVFVLNNEKGNIKVYPRFRKV